MFLHGKLLRDPAESPREGWLRIEGGRIAESGEGSPPERAALGHAGAIISPGFVDAHVHLPQFGAIGCDGPGLEQWLEEVIYPAEAAWVDEAFAAAQMRAAYARLVRAGTLGFAGYLTSHPHSVDVAVRVAHQLPLRAIVGQVLMDRNAPPTLTGLPEARLVRSARGRLDCSLNPRFAVACTDALLARVGKRRAGGFPFSFKEREEGEMGLHLYLQTHLAESETECARVRQLFPDAPHYAGVYDRHGLLNERTILAHCVHLSDDEWNLLADRNCIVAHCPGANTFLQSGLFDFSAARSRGIRVGLGSDIAAGPDVAMPRVARAMIEVAKLRRLTIDDHANVPTPAVAWRMITRGNAEALGWQDMGSLDVGSSADLLIIDAPVPHDEHLIGRLIYGWRDDWITGRIVAGRIVDLSIK